MADTIEEQILVGIENALATITGLTGGVTREREDAHSAAQTPAIDFRVLNNTPTQETLDFTMWQMLVRVVIYVRGVKPTSIAKQWRQPIHAAMLSLRLPDAFDIPNMVQYVYPGNVQFDQQGGGDGDMGAVAADYIFQFRTDYNDLTVLGA